MAPSSRYSSNLGQIIEYIPDRLYLASYVETPNEHTLFPYPDPPPRSPTKRSQRNVGGAVRDSGRKQPYYFTVDDTLLYNAFHHDFGPLHIGHLYRFALQFHEILGAKENKDRPIVFYSRADPRSRANASCLLACYMVLIQSWPPHLALAPIAQVDPPLMPFRDAGYSQADYGITVQDIVYGVWKAKEEGCCVLENFDLDEYEKYERVEHGDFNWISPNFLAFASPQSTPAHRTPEGTEDWASLPKTLAQVDLDTTLNQPFKNVLKHFKERDIGLVVRLNSVLYDASYFEALGIQHVDMIFEDGTCPPLSTVRKFIRMAHEMITARKKGIAVHCKAGLGRTGCLIGAYLIYRYGFTANEVIAYMRFMRPGMVVGPQQHWLHLNQGVFREWWIEERIERKLRKEAAAAAKANGTHVPSTPMRSVHKSSAARSSHKHGTSTPPNKAAGRTPLGEMDQEHARDNSIGVQEDFLPAPTPGQPRKSRRAGDGHPYARNGNVVATVEEEQALEQQITETEIISMQRTSQGNESDEEWHLRMRSQRKAAASASPDRRAVSQQTSTTTTIYSSVVVDNDASNDIENIGVAAARATKSYEHQQRASSTPGVLTKVRGSSATPKRAERGAAIGAAAGGPAGVRKTSGRIGSASHSTSPGAVAATVRKISAGIQ
ncbi:putative tyrosine-protein phosphatase CDC14 [Cladorrhinum samala]|uniref:protein-tyrosine-phosphatase n=1 Tax=Cladorrhinum samala TaxID=585594 RepID=A0AAV9HKH0_9PEZI|nr:putative tyrosine-protein phosphatase CDC14 [Cladorrhinum samala]